MSEYREPKTHYLKTWPEYFVQIRNGSKTFEIRKDDRDFWCGDLLVLQEFDPHVGALTGEEEARVISYILRDAENFGLMPGFAILAFATEGVA